MMQYNILFLAWTKKLKLVERKRETMQRKNKAKDATSTKPSILLQFEARWFRAAQCT